MKILFIRLIILRQYLQLLACLGYLSTTFSFLSSDRKRFTPPATSTWHRATNHHASSSSHIINWNNNECLRRTRHLTALRSHVDESIHPEDPSGSLFLDTTKPIPTRQWSTPVPPSILASIRIVKQRYISNIHAAHSESVHKLIVQMGLQWTTTKTQRQCSQTDAQEQRHLRFPNMERVPGCLATVHLQTTLIPTTDNGDETHTKSPENYRVSIDGSADAMLSGGLLAILDNIFSDDDVTAAHVLQLEATVLTTAMGMQALLSPGRNDGMASMVTVVQRQIRSLLSIDPSAEPSTAYTDGQTHNAKTTKNDAPRVAMLLSGGVDSSVALHLLLRQNYNVTAFYLRIWLEDELAHLGECPWEDDLKVCREVCEHAGNVPLHTLSLGTEYRERVVRYTIEEARRGRTPNPDIMCNSRVKFGCFLEYIERNGKEFDYVASGHYARLEEDDIETTQKRLFRAPDTIKDQSYFLCTLTQQQLSKVLFPIGNYQKSQVRELAAQFQLPNRHRPDSQGLCFLGKVRFDDFLSSYLGNNPGDVVDALNGEVIGHHNGLWYHTVGQRKGIGKVMFPIATAKGPWYVVAKDQERNVVYVSNRYEEEDFAKARSEFEVEDVTWIAGAPPKQSRDGNSWKELQLDMKIRHGPKIVQGFLLLKDDGYTGNIRLEKKDGGLAPGQYVVFYQSETDECLGAGVISERHWANFLNHYDELVVTSTT